MEVIIVLQK